MAAPKAAEPQAEFPLTHQSVAEVDAEHRSPGQVVGQLGQRLHFDGDEVTAGWDHAILVGSSLSNPWEEVNGLRKNNKWFFSSYITAKEHSSPFSAPLGQQGLAPKDPTGLEVTSINYRDQLETDSKGSSSPAPLCKGFQTLLEVFEGIRESCEGMQTTPWVRRNSQGVSGWLIKQINECVRQTQMHIKAGMCLEGIYSFTLKKRWCPVRCVRGKDRSQCKELISPGNAVILVGSNSAVHKNPYFKVKLMSLAFSHI